MAHIDQSGKTVNAWTILHRVENSTSPAIHYQCRCICGFEGPRNVMSILIGSSKSCGCTKRIGTESRDCKICGIHKPANLFQQMKIKDGGERLSYRCKDCDHQYYLKNKERFAENTRRNRVENRDAYNETRRKWRSKNSEKINAESRRQHPNRKEYRNAAWRKWYEQNKETVIAKSRERYEKNKASRRAYVAKWRKANPDYFRKASKKRRALQAGASVIENINRDEIITRDNSTCYLCRRFLAAKEVTLDHVQPLSRGGNETTENLRVCCKSCNSRKNSSTLDEFYIRYPASAYPQYKQILAPLPTSKGTPPQLPEPSSASDLLERQTAP